MFSGHYVCMQLVATFSKLWNAVLVIIILNQKGAGAISNYGKKGNRTRKIKIKIAAFKRFGCNLWEMKEPPFLPLF